MKKYVLGLIIIIIISIVGYFIYDNYIKETEYSIVYREFSKEDIKEIEQYGKIKEVMDGKVEVSGVKIEGQIDVYIKGSEKKRKDIISKIKQNGHIDEVYEDGKDIAGSIQ